MNKSPVWLASKPIVIGYERRWKLVDRGHHGEVHEIDYEHEESGCRVICGASTTARSREGSRKELEIVGFGGGGGDLESRTKWSNAEGGLSQDRSTLQRQPLRHEYDNLTRTMTDTEQSQTHHHSFVILSLISMYHVFVISYRNIDIDPYIYYINTC